MRGFDTATLEYHFQRLDGDALAALVADLYAARGYETTREGALVSATAGDGTLHVRVSGAGGQTRRPDGPVDVVVALDAADSGRGRLGGARLVDAAALAEMLTHAIDRAAARELCERHLGAPPADLPQPPATRARRRLDAVTRWSTAGAVLGVALLVLGVALSVAGWLPDSPVTGADEPAGRGLDTAGVAVDADGPASGPEGVPSLAGTTGTARSRATPVSVAGTATPAAGNDAPPVTDRELPPGLTLRGVVDVAALAAAHHRVASNRSHTVHLDRYPLRAEPNASHLRRDLTIATTGDRYLVTTGAHYPRTRHLGAVYHDGTEAYGVYWNGDRDALGWIVSLAEDSDRAPTPEAGRTAIERYLATPRSVLVGRADHDGRTVYRVVGKGQPGTGEFGHVEAYTAAALVDERGFVHELTVWYTVRDGVSRREIRREIAYERLGTTTLEPPSWYERRAENGTN